MKIIKYFLVVVLLLALNSCKDNTTNPPDDNNNKPPGYQEDIDWPSLADSPWPMFQHDPQCTGRSINNGPMDGNILWEYIPELTINTGSVIDNNDKINFMTTYGAFRITDIGNVVDSIFMGSSKKFVSPLVTNDKNIIFFDGFSNIISLTNNLDTNWIFSLPVANELYIRSFNIDKEGNIYIANGISSTLFSISAAGTLNWQKTNEKLYNQGSFSTSFSPDGKTLYLSGQNYSLIAIDIETRNIKWTIGNKLSFGSTVDCENNIYFQNQDGFYCADGSGNVKWSYPIITDINFSGSPMPSIDKFGNLYIATDTLYAFSNNGQLLWKYFLSDPIDSPILIDAENNLFFCTNNLSSTVVIWKFNRQGDLIWKLPQNETVWSNAPAISGDGKLVFPFYNKLVTIK